MPRSSHTHPKMHFTALQGDSNSIKLGGKINHHHEFVRCLSLVSTRASYWLLLHPGADLVLVRQKQQCSQETSRVQGQPGQHTRPRVGSFVHFEKENSRAPRRGST